jgi:hypothetical protein
VIASWLGLAHEAKAQHVKCAEHGELVDATVAGAQVSAHRPGDHGVTATGHEHAPRLRAAGLVAVGHEHCALTSSTRAQRIEPTAPALTAARFAVSEAPVAPACQLASRCAAVYRTAPKTSPPV